MSAPVDLPTVINTKSYSIQLNGKLTFSSTQTLPPQPGPGQPAIDSSWSIGAVTFANNTGTKGILTIASVQCPFVLTIHDAPANATDAARKLLVTFGGNQVYLDGGGVPSGGTPGYTVVLDSTITSPACTSGTTDIEAYGWNGTQGSGVRIYDVQITQ
ncbi:MAG TPA: hypothetical protein VFW00_03205 [Rhodocyclaceae bacterium]|nr:hypothetical protein [Rhodocyclaceae bacterium]